MTFNWNDALPTVRDELRQRIGDTHVNEGPLPTGRNFSNENIDAALSSGSVFGFSISGDLERGVLYYFVILKAKWTRFAVVESEDNTTFNGVKPADYYEIEIKRLRADIGIVSKTKFNGVIPIERVTRFTV